MTDDPRHGSGESEAGPALRDKAWFAAKRYGYGAGLPIAWQGWLAMGVYVAAISAAMGLLRGPPRIVAGVAVTAGFIGVAALKTEGGWRWRWGRERSD